MFEQLCCALKYGKTQSRVRCILFPEIKTKEKTQTKNRQIYANYDQRSKHILCLTFTSY